STGSTPLNNESELAPFCVSSLRFQPSVFGRSPTPLGSPKRRRGHRGTEPFAHPLDRGAQAWRPRRGARVLVRDYTLVGVQKVETVPTRSLPAWRGSRFATDNGSADTVPKDVGARSPSDAR